MDQNYKKAQNFLASTKFLSIAQVDAFVQKKIKEGQSYLKAYQEFFLQMVRLFIIPSYVHNSNRII